MSNPESQISYNESSLDEISRKNTEYHFLEAVNNPLVEHMPKELVIKYLADLATEHSIEEAGDEQEQALNDKINDKKRELFYDALTALGEVTDFLSADITEWLSPDYPERAELLYEKLKHLTDDLDEKYTRLSDDPQTYLTQDPPKLDTDL